ncbi:MAG: hypothetical protein CXT77_03185 [uncultured DHVE6 group euryarchaeote]|jgi:hypothetical protein|nr:MAG: hypothetical protein CXT77_03185 [uncultured DHVE6 group euryarchaeote]
MKTVRIRQKITDYLSPGPRNTSEILEHINSTMRHGTTSQQLGNVLSKDKHVIKIGFVKKSGILSGGYDICQWATPEWVREHMLELDSNEIVYKTLNGSVKTYFLSNKELKKFRNFQESLDDIIV